MSNTEKVCSINVKVSHGKTELNFKLKGDESYLSRFTDKELISRAIDAWDEFHTDIYITQITIDRNF